MDQLLFCVLILLLTVGYSTTTPDSSYCTQCDQWSLVTTLGTSYKPLVPLSLILAEYPVLSFLCEESSQRTDIATIFCTSQLCANTYPSFLEGPTFLQVVSISLPSGHFIRGDVTSTLVTQLTLCETQNCFTYSDQQVTWPGVTYSIGIALPFGAKYPVLFGAGNKKIYFLPCSDEACDNTDFITVSETSLTTTTNQTSFTIDGHSNWVAVTQAKQQLTMFFCHEGGVDCQTSILPSTVNTPKFSIVAPPNSNFYADGLSYPVIMQCKSNHPTSFTFCLGDYCSQNQTVSIGTSPVAASIAFGPDNLPVIAFIDSSKTYITHCFDYVCGSFMQPLTTSSKYSFIDVALVLDGPYMFMMAVNITGGVYSSVFCGPYVTSYSPSSTQYNGTALTVSIDGDFCSSDISTCKANNQTSQSKIISSAQVQCTFNAPGANSEVALSIGNSPWTEYASVGSILFYGPSSSPSPTPTCTPSATASPSQSSVPSTSSSVTPTSSVAATPSRTPSLTPSPSVTPSTSLHPTSSASPSYLSSPSPSASPNSTHSSSSDNTKIAVTMLSTVITSFFAVSIITTYAYFRWSKAKTYSPPQQISWSWANFVTLVAIPLDFLQFCAFSTNIEAEWAHVIYTVSQGTIFVIPNLAYLLLFWVVLISTMLWCLYVLPFFIRVNYNSNRITLAEWLQRFKVFQALYYPASLIMIPFVNCLFFGISNVLLQMVSCKYWGDDTDHPVLSMDNNIECWSGIHIFLGLSTIAVFFAYFPMAIHLMPKLQQASADLDIKYDEKFLFISSILKLVICVVHALFAEWEVPRLMTVCAVTLVLTLVNMEMEPCNVHRINSIRSAVYFAACCCAICSVGATFAAKNNIMPLILLMVSWGIIILLVILAQLGIVRHFINKKNDEMLKALTEDHS